jgi:hypothetical protein
MTELKYCICLNILWRNKVYILAFDRYGWPTWRHERWNINNQKRRLLKMGKTLELNSYDFIALNSDELSTVDGGASALLVTAGIVAVAVGVVVAAPVGIAIAITATTIPGVAAAGLTLASRGGTAIITGSR